jgi:hypothetical protein
LLPYFGSYSFAARRNKYSNNSFYFFGSKKYGKDFFLSKPIYGVVPQKKLVLAIDKGANLFCGFDSPQSVHAPGTPAAGLLVLGRLLLWGGGGGILLKKAVIQCP